MKRIISIILSITMLISISAGVSSEALAKTNGASFHSAALITKKKTSKSLHSIHIMRAVKNVKPTCTEKGYTLYQCYLCSYTNKKYTSAPLGHKEVTVKGTPATCTEDGLSDGSVCSVCNKVLQKQKKLPALDHDWECEIAKATPVADGKIYNYCTRCDEHFETVIARPFQYNVNVSSTTYTGSEIRPSVTVYDSDGALIHSDDYELSYRDNINVGTGKIIITFTGESYEGTKEISFTIKEKPQGTTTEVFTNAPSIVSLTKSGRKVTVKFSTKMPMTKYRIQYSGNKVFNGPGTSLITKTVSMNQKYGTATFTPALTCGNTIYVRVCAMYPAGGFTKWSIVKSIKL